MPPQSGVGTIPNMTPGNMPRPISMGPRGAEGSLPPMPNAMGPLSQEAELVMAAIRNGSIKKLAGESDTSALMRILEKAGEGGSAAAGRASGQSASEVLGQLLNQTGF